MARAWREASEVVRDRRVLSHAHLRVGRLTGVYKNTSRGIVALVFRCHAEGGHERLSEESAAVEWLTPGEVTSRMTEVYAVRVTDALLNGAPHVRAHDGRKPAGRRGPG